MGHAFQLKRNDRVPAVSVPLLDRAGNAIASSAIATGQFLMRASGAATYLVRGTATVTDTVALGLSGPEGSRAALAYPWGATDTATAGYFEGEFEIRDTGGRARTLPVDGYLPVTVIADLGP